MAKTAEKTKKSGKESSAEAPARRRVPLTTQKWEEGGVEEFPGILNVCAYRESDDKYNESRGFPRPIEQWHVEVERMDALYDLPDGEEAPVKAYMTCDLESMNKAGQIRPVQLGSNKTTFAVQGWEKAKVKLDPDPSANEGKKFMFRRWRTKLFGTFAAKDIIVPLKRLPDDYELDDDVEVQHFVVSEKDQSLEEAAESTPAASSKAKNNGKGDVAEINWKGISLALNGYEEDDDFSELLTDPETKIFFKDAKVKKAVASGDIVDLLKEKGLISVSKKGKISAIEQKEEPEENDEDDEEDEDDDDE